MKNAVGGGGILDGFQNVRTVGFFQNYFGIKFGFILLINVGLYYVLEEVKVICLGLFNLV